MRTLTLTLTLLALTLFLSACGATRVNYTLFLKEDGSTLQNLKGDECSESGYQLDTDGKRLITFYSNCDVHKYRTLQEFEIKQWKPSGSIQLK